HAIEAGAIDAGAAFPVLGEVIAGRKPGRVSDAQCLICDLTGTGVQDTAIAGLAVARGRLGRGRGFGLSGGHPKLSWTGRSPSKHNGSEGSTYRVTPDVSENLQAAGRQRAPNIRRLRIQ